MTYTASPPPTADYRDVLTTALASLPTKPLSIQISADHTTLTVVMATPLTGSQVTTFQSAIAATVADASAPWHRYDTLAAALAGVPTTLRAQATTAAGTTVTTANNNAVTQTILNDLAVFCARLADLLEYLGVPV
jgi:hypothetical protein